MNKKINLIFPIAGQGTRFNGQKFKPFLEIGDITFIETAFNSFLRYKHLINDVIFICTEEQEKAFSVENTLKKIIDHPSIKVIKMPIPTSGPYQTLRSALTIQPEVKSFDGVTIICDCDHTLDVAPIFDKIATEEFDVLIPCWGIKEDEQKNWSKVVLSDNKIQGIFEKEIIHTNDLKIKGIIGCIAFNNINEIFDNDNFRYVSDSLKELLKQGKRLKIVDITDAGFFGDSKMLDTYVNQLRKRATIFCDIDGVLVKHKPHSNFGPDNVLLPDVNKLNVWKKNKHKIVMTSARNPKYRKKLMEYLNLNNIPYDDLVMGLPAGQRILINDRKPSKHFARQAIAIELPRDYGLADVSIDEHIDANDINILCKFDGNSFANTYLIESNSKKFVRKYITKNKNTTIHYNKLKRQCNDLIRLNCMLNDSTPEIYSETENDYEYFFDMEYLENYRKLSEFPPPKQAEVMDLLLPKLNKEVYCFKKTISDTNWINDFLAKKIYPKFALYSEDTIMNELIFSDTVTINSKKYLGLEKTLKTINLAEYNPAFISPVHGDLTFDNILYNDRNDDFKLIDMDGSDYFDAPELDLGKLFQSCVSRYNEWKDLESPAAFENGIQCIEDFFEIVPTAVNQKVIRHWSAILNTSEEETVKLGIFYMCTFFIRFVPFRQQISREHGLFALLLSIAWLNKLIK